VEQVSRQPGMREWASALSNAELTALERRGHFDAMTH
jgi:hypothetical protein